MIAVNNIAGGLCFDEFIGAHWEVQVLRLPRISTPSHKNGFSRKSEADLLQQPWFHRGLQDLPMFVDIVFSSSCRHLFQRLDG